MQTAKAHNCTNCANNIETWVDAHVYRYGGYHTESCKEGHWQDKPSENTQLALACPDYKSEKV